MAPGANPMSSTNKEQQRIDEARFGVALLATLDLRQVQAVLVKYMEYRDDGWVPDVVGIPETTSEQTP